MPVRRLEKLPGSIMSSSQLYQIISIIDSIVESSSKSGKKSGQKLDIDLESYPQFKGLIHGEVSLGDLVGLKTKLEDLMEKVPVVRLTLSDFPDQKFCRELTEWFRDINPFCLVEIFIDDTIIGGVIIRCGRKTHDHSIRSQLIKAEGNLTGILTNV